MGENQISILSNDKKKFLSEYTEREELSKLGKDLSDLSKKFEKVLHMALNDGLKPEREDMQ